MPGSGGVTRATAALQLPLDEEDTLDALLRYVGVPMGSGQADAPRPILISLRNSKKRSNILAVALEL